jgi:hypothetical protein
MPPPSPRACTWLLTLPPANAPLLAAHPFTRYLCANTTTGRAYLELHGSQRRSWLDNVCRGLLAADPRPLCRDTARASVHADVEVGVWNELGQGMRSDLATATTPASTERDSTDAPATA